MPVQRDIKIAGKMPSLRKATAGAASSALTRNRWSRITSHKLRVTSTAFAEAYNVAAG